MTLEAKALTERLKKATTATLNDGAQNPKYGAWYVVSRYNTTAAKYIVLTAMIGAVGNLYGTVLTAEGADGKIVTTYPKTYKQVLAAFN
jgi:hypothetical protein